MRFGFFFIRILDGFFIHEQVLIIVEFSGVRDEADIILNSFIIFGQHWAVFTLVFAESANFCLPTMIWIDAIKGKWVLGYVLLEIVSRQLSFILLLLDQGIIVRLEILLGVVGVIRRVCCCEAELSDCLFEHLRETIIFFKPKQPLHKVSVFIFSSLVGPSVALFLHSDEKLDGDRDPSRSHILLQRNILGSRACLFIFLAHI